MSKRVATVLLFLAGLALSAFAQEGAQAAAGIPLGAWKYLSAALAVSFACIGGRSEERRVGKECTG
jgi:hypothetical protein